MPSSRMRACASRASSAMRSMAKTLPGEAREHRRLVAGARADLQHAAVLVDFEQLGHARDDVGLRDGLVGGDGQGVVAVGVRLAGLRARRGGAARPPIAREHALVADAVMLAQVFDHPLALPAVLRRRGRPLRAASWIQTDCSDCPARTVRPNTQGAISCAPTRVRRRQRLRRARADGDLRRAPALAARPRPRRPRSSVAADRARSSSRPTRARAWFVMSLRSGVTET